MTLTRIRLVSPIKKITLADVLALKLRDVNSMEREMIHYLSTLISPLRVIPRRHTLHTSRKTVVSPYSDSSSNSTRKSSPPPSPKTSSDDDSSAPSTARGKPVHINFINPLRTSK